MDLPEADMFLSEETQLVAEDSSGNRAIVNAGNIDSAGWRTISISAIPRLALVITLNSRVVFEPTKITVRDVGFISFGLTQRGFAPNELRVVVRFLVMDDSTPAEMVSPEIEVFSENVPGFDPRSPWVERQFELDKVRGRTGAFIVECASASESCCEKDEIGIYEFVVSNDGSVDLNRARAFKQLRISNEKINFSAYYQHPIFQSGDQRAVVEANPDIAGTLEIRHDSFERKNPFFIPLKRLYRAITSRRATNESPGCQPREKDQSTSEESPPVNSISAFSHSHHVLLTKLGLNPPLFGWRLQTKLKEFSSPGKANAPSMFRVLSLCSGAARIEADLMRILPAGKVKMTLVDVNPNLLNTAKQKLSQLCEVEAILGDVNELNLQGEKFDAIMCVSGLHHVVELEHLIETVANGLSDSGEFWCIGETIGRNGGRLWPESYEVANAFFSKLDKKYRLNRVTGFIDEYLPDMDYSIGCFEGIRCEAIEPTLLTYLSPVDVCKHNCIIWKLFSPTYSDNYDMQCPEDVALIEEAVDLDIALFRRGGRPIELNGVYERRR
jgi:SAM-dependent methyltransferase